VHVQQQPYDGGWGDGARVRPAVFRCAVVGADGGGGLR
jgi:hypothetical protein